MTILKYSSSKVRGGVGGTRAPPVRPLRSGVAGANTNISKTTKSSALAREGGGRARGGSGYARSSTISRKWVRGDAISASLGPDRVEQNDVTAAATSDDSNRDAAGGLVPPSTTRGPVLSLGRHHRHDRQKAPPPVGTKRSLTWRREHQPPQADQGQPQLEQQDLTMLKRSIELPDIPSKPESSDEIDPADAPSGVSSLHNERGKMKSNQEATVKAGGGDEAMIPTNSKKRKSTDQSSTDSVESNCYATNDQTSNSVTRPLQMLEAESTPIVNSNLVRVGPHKLERLDVTKAAHDASIPPRPKRMAVATKPPPVTSTSPGRPPPRTYRTRGTKHAPESRRPFAAQRIKLEPNADSAPTESNSEMDHSRNSGKTYTDHCYRSSSQSQHRKLVKVPVDASKTPICPHFARGTSCLDPRCRLRHDVSLEASRPFCRYFQDHGQCLRDNCPFRHVKVNPYATPCPAFALLGYCDDPNCELMHVVGSSSRAGTGTTATHADRSAKAAAGSATSYRWQAGATGK